MSDHGMEPQRDRWTAEEDATLVRLVAKGRSASEIGMELGRSRNAVCGRIHRKKLQPKHNELKRVARQAQPPRRPRSMFTPDEDKVILEMGATGKSGLDIGGILGRNKSSIVKRARLLGMTLNGKNGPKPSAGPKVKRAKRFNVLGIVQKAQSDRPDFDHVTPVVAVEPLMVALVDLTSSHCRFPVGDPRQEGFGFCGHPTGDGAYCRHHAAIAYIAPEMRRRVA
jgi:GcrA cell cycle regulator